jgi:SAM-dependent methyltransferase
MSWWRTVSDLHPATRGFADSDRYERGRPDYPAEAVAAIVSELDLRPGRTVLDLAAGTGKLTRLLVPSGANVIAVEPLREMREKIEGVVALAGTAERIPITDGFVDAVTVGTAFHWFDADRALREIHRVLSPGGGVGLIWNARDERVPWVAALGALLAVEARGHLADQTVVEQFVRELPAHDELLESGIVQTVTPQQVVAGIGTRSYVATMDPPAREAFLDRIRELLATHPDTRGRDVLELPHLTAAHRLRPF